MSNYQELFCDPSINHLAYVITDIDDSEKKATIVAYGMVWTKPSWTRGQKYSYLQKVVASMINGTFYFLPKKVTTESFFANPKMRTGTFTTPVVNGLIEMTCSAYSVEFDEVSPPDWRKVLSIKPTKVGGKRDYKEPTKDAVFKYIKKISFPTTIKSNITLIEREMPHDITDALAIALASYLKKGYTVDFVINEPMNIMIEKELYTYSKLIK